jgi:hypothetical protein
MVQVVESLPSKHEALFQIPVLPKSKRTQNPETTKKKKDS